MKTDLPEIYSTLERDDPRIERLARFLVKKLNFPWDGDTLVTSHVPLQIDTHVRLVDDPRDAVPLWKTYVSTAIWVLTLLDYDAKGPSQ